MWSRLFNGPVMAPSDPVGLRRSFAEARRRYAARIHAREYWTGHLWQGRFSAAAMDERHLMAAARHVSMNPAGAGLVARTQDWPWSSARAQRSLARPNAGASGLPIKRKRRLGSPPSLACHNCLTRFRRRRALWDAVFRLCPR